MIEISNENFVLFAAHFYDNPSCVSTEEFEEDLDRFKYIKRLCTKYKDSGVLKERLILNHLVILYNLFGPECTKMILFKLPKEDWKIIIPFIKFLGYLPNVIVGIKDQSPINTSEITTDEFVEKILSKSITNEKIILPTKHEEFA